MPIDRIQGASWADHNEIGLNLDPFMNTSFQPKRDLDQTSSIEALKATVKTLEQVENLAAKLSETSQVVRETQSAVLDVIGNVARGATEAAANLPAAAANLHTEVSKADFADKIELFVTSGVKGVLGYFYVTSVYVPSQIICGSIGLVVMAVGLSDWWQGKGNETLLKGQEVASAPTRWIINLCKSAVYDKKIVANQSFDKFYADIDQVMANVFEVKSAKPLVSTVGFICKSVTLSGYVGVVVPVTVISLILGVCAMPSGGFNRGMKIAAMPLLIPSTIITRMIYEDLPEIYRGYTELMKSKGTATNR